MPNMKALSFTVKTLYSMLKFADGQTDGRTDGQTDRAITIGHPPSGGALIIIENKCLILKNSSNVLYTEFRVLEHDFLI